jgi:hypothetical protein
VSFKKEHIIHYNRVIITTNYRKGRKSGDLKDSTEDKKLSNEVNRLARLRK